jgi:hypothetical protein
MISRMGVWTGLAICSCSAVAFAVSESMPGGGAGECVVQTRNGWACDGVPLNYSRVCGPNSNLGFENCPDLVGANYAVYGVASSDCGAADYSTENKLCSYFIGVCTQVGIYRFCDYTTDTPITRNRQSTTNFHGDCFPCS